VEIENASGPGNEARPRVRRWEASTFSFWLAASPIKRCAHCSAFAVTEKKIREYREQGRLSLQAAGHAPARSLGSSSTLLYDQFIEHQAEARPPQRPLYEA